MLLACLRLFHAAWLASAPADVDAVGVCVPIDPDALPADAASLLRKLVPDTMCAHAAQRATAYHAYHSLGVARAGQGMPKVGVGGAELRRWWTRCPSEWSAGTGSWT